MFPNPHSHNRLLRLEQELLRLRQAVMGKAAAFNVSTSPPLAHNNRLLKLEQDLNRCRRRDWGSPHPPTPPESTSVKSTQQPPLHWQVQARAFDFNEAIALEYSGNPFVNVSNTHPKGGSDNHQTSVIPSMQSASALDWFESALADLGPFQVEAFAGDLPLPLPSQIHAQPRLLVQPTPQPQKTLNLPPLPIPSALKTMMQGSTPSPSTPPVTNPSTHEQSILNPLPVAPPKNTPAASVPPPAPVEMMSVSQPPSHSVFDHLTQNLTYATSFDLGTVALEQRLDEFDRLLDQGNH
jgi:hypothetical protein